MCPRAFDQMAHKSVEKMQLKNGITLDTLHGSYAIIRYSCQMGVRNSTILHTALKSDIYFYKEDRIDVLCNFRNKRRL